MIRSYCHTSRIGKIIANQSIFFLLKKSLLKCTNLCHPFLYEIVFCPIGTFLITYIRRFSTLWHNRISYPHELDCFLLLLWLILQRAREASHAARTKWFTMTNMRYRNQNRGNSAVIIGNFNNVCMIERIFPFECLVRTDAIKHVTEVYRMCTN